MNQKCIKCKKFDETFQCNGCEKFFCHQHFGKHREELSNQMHRIKNEYHRFEEDINKNDRIQTHLSRIDTWENESTNKIQRKAETARNDLSQIPNRIKISLNQINNHIQSNDYTEHNLNQWKNELNKLRELYKTSFTDDIIQLNKTIDKNQILITERSHSISDERFDTIIGLATLAKIVGKEKRLIVTKDGFTLPKECLRLSKDRRTATCSGPRWNGARVIGYNLYSTGVHSLRFRILNKHKPNLFFGIVSAAIETNPWNEKTPYAYGWWEIPLKTDEKDYEEVDEKIVKKKLDIQKGDEVTLRLDCLNNQIELEHHRTNRYISETIPTEQCPFPWKIAISLYSRGDSVRILS